MKAYIGYRKTKEKLEYGLTVYSDTGKVVFSNIKTVTNNNSDNTSGKFNNALQSLIWGIKQINMQTERGLLPTEDKIYLMVGNKTVYNWFEANGSIRQYAVEFADLMFEINLLMNDVEVIQVNNHSKYILYTRRGTTEDIGFQKLSDMFDDIEE